jgi:hypothetical protein
MRYQNEICGQVRENVGAHDEWKDNDRERTPQVAEDPKGE